MSTQTIKDTLAPRETNGQVVFLKKLHWFKTESQVERLPLQNRHHTNRPHHTPPSNTPSASTAPPPVLDFHLTFPDPACGTAHMRPSHATTTPGSTHATLVANIKPTMNGDVLVNSQPQN
ncbi:hypothetical protein CGCSCA4_v010103 [Colletotrichum siamense]|uniref:Uncharacterized protein n=1 Tax=Colletotrichum siamense TaxID=690259 RepID=A0A9P5EQ38_COLSI|nr:hypothetical protein CGCSCA4_v010103 [Colletotrichum siamense]KAF4857381.1 hypothetical protein CGCSCA2_v008330 [Colletotrichum siamense]